MISVLLVDDEPPALDSGKRYLEAQGHYKVSTTLSPLTALGMLKTGHYDIIISDYNMPDMDGIGFLKQVRAAYPSLPFILYTSKSRSDIAGEAFDNEADFYLQRTGNPVLVMEELTQKIQLIVERRSMQEALRSREEQFRIIFHNQQTGLLMIDAVTHTITDANAAALSMIGVSREDVIGKICHTFICPAEKGKCPVTDLGQTVDNSERVLIRANGEKVPILKSVNPVKIGGRPFLIESFIDISERKRAEAALKESNERYISYIKEAAMRLKTPVEVVEQNITTLLEDIKAGDAEGEQVLLQLQIQVKNMEQIRQNILDLNKTIVDGYGEISPASKQFLTE